MIIYAAYSGFTGVKWVDIIIYTASGLAACGVIWKKAVKPIVHGFSVMETSIPVLLEIAAEFKHDGPHGESLKDILTRMEAGLSENTTQIKLVTSRQETQGLKLDELHTYAHSSSHEQKQELQKLTLADDIIMKKVDDLAERTSQRRFNDSPETDTDY